MKIIKPLKSLLFVIFIIPMVNGCSCLGDPLNIDAARDFRFTNKGNTGYFTAFNVTHAGKNDGLYISNNENNFRRVTESEVTDFILTSSENYLVYIENGSLYSYNTSQEIKVNLSGTNGASSFVINNDETLVAFTDTSGDKLYVNSISGNSDAILISHDKSANTAIIDSFAFTPDGENVVFISDTATPGVFRLYAATTDASSLITLSQNTESNQDLSVQRFDITPDGANIIYTGDTEVDDVVRLYQVPISGGVINTLSNNTHDSTGHDVSDFKISPDGSFVVFRGDTEISGLIRLYSVTLNEGIVTDLTPNLSNPDLDVGEYEITSNSDRIIYIGDTENYGVYRLYGVNPDGTDHTTLSNNLESSGLTAQKKTVQLFSLLEDGRTVLFAGDTLTDGLSELFAVSVYGNNDPILLSDGLEVEKIDEGVQNFQASTEAQSVVFLSSEHLYAASLDGRTLFELTPGSEQDFQVLAFSMSENNNILFEARDWEKDESSHEISLYRINLDGSNLDDIIPF